MRTVLNAADARYHPLFMTERTASMGNTAVVTGASSGVGRSVAIQLARAGWNVAATARRESALKETIALAGDGGAQVVAFPCDIGDARAVDKTTKAILERFGPVQALVNAAGTNAPNRSWSQLTLETYREIMEANLTGAYLFIQAFLPGMRQQGRGTVVNIVSDAGLIANAKAGAAYVMSKFGMAGMTQSLNAEERGNGIRATAIFPGDIDTPLLEKRPVPPPAEARQKMLRPEDIAECVMLAINLPERAIIESLLIRPR
jgi:NAD(P)-dependent dehydrogenase (short-subunit alcohol dehydrogenase family)